MERLICRLKEKGLASLALTTVTFVRPLLCYVIGAGRQHDLSNHPFAASSLFQGLQTTYATEDPTPFKPMGPTGRQIDRKWLSAQR